MEGSCRSGRVGPGWRAALQIAPHFRLRVSTTGEDGRPLNIVFLTGGKTELGRAHNSIKELARMKKTEKADGALSAKYNVYFVVPHMGSLKENFHGRLWNFFDHEGGIHPTKTSQSDGHPKIKFSAEDKANKTHAMRHFWLVKDETRSEPGHDERSYYDSNALKGFADAGVKLIGSDTFVWRTGHGLADPDAEGGCCVPVTTGQGQGEEVESPIDFIVFDQWGAYDANWWAGYMSRHPFFAHVPAMTWSGNMAGKPFDREGQWTHLATDVEGRGRLNLFDRRKMPMFGAFYEPSYPWDFFDDPKTWTVNAVSEKHQGTPVNLFDITMNAGVDNSIGLTEGEENKKRAVKLAPWAIVSEHGPGAQEDEKPLSPELLKLQKAYENGKYDALIYFASGTRSAPLSANVTKYYLDEMEKFGGPTGLDGKKALVYMGMPFLMPCQVFEPRTGYMRLGKGDECKDLPTTYSIGEQSGLEEIFADGRKQLIAKIPANVMLVDFAPQKELFRAFGAWRGKKTAAGGATNESINLIYIHHGGAGGVTEAMGHAVPMLGIPQMGTDMAPNSGRVANMGCGEDLSGMRTAILNSGGLDPVKPWIAPEDGARDAWEQYVAKRHGHSYKGQPAADRNLLQSFQSGKGKFEWEKYPMLADATGVLSKTLRFMLDDENFQGYVAKLQETRKELKRTTIDAETQLTAALETELTRKFQRPKQ
eukprot:g19161.t1